MPHDHESDTEVDTQVDKAPLPLTRDERREALRRTTPGVAVVYEAIRAEAKIELARSNAALFWSGLAAGLSMGFSFLAEALLASDLPDAAWAPLISKFGYSVGFLIVILGRQQLFTENTLTPVLHLLQEKSRAVLGNTLRLWGVVLSANFLGTFAFALALATTTLVEGERVAMLGTIATHALEGGFADTFVKAIGAGWLIALMVWLLPVAANSRVAVIIIITYLVGIAGFPHIIAGASEAFYALLTGAAPLDRVLLEFLIPTLLGNTLGGVALVAAINYAQVHADAD